MEKEIFQKEVGHKPIEIPKEKRKLETKSYDYSVIFLNSAMVGNDSKITLEVPFQRKFIWGTERSSQLIESIIMNVPIPPLYFAEENNKWLVLDGLQRLNSIKAFFENEFALKNLEIITELEGLKYKDLPPRPKSLLNDGLLRINVIQEDSHPDIKFDVFMRLNKGAVTLNDQELRNCLYRGSLINLAKNLANNPSLLSVIGIKKPHPRFLDVEFILRYFAFSETMKENERNEFFLEGYAGSLREFLNGFLTKKKDVTAQEIEILKQKFETTIEKVLAVFTSKTAFRDPSSKSKVINKALADCILLSFEKYEKQTLESHKTQIIDLLTEQLNNEKFHESISQRTSDTKNVNFRLNTWLKSLANILHA